MSHYIRVGFVVFAFILFFVFILLPATACGCRGGDRYMRQQWHMQEVLDALQHYLLDHGEPPRTDDQSPWYIKLTEEPDANNSRCCPGGYLFDLPIDEFGNMLIVEYPADNWNFTIRSIGENGIDDGGKRDDWTLGSEPNLGYWYKDDWVNKSAFASLALFVSLCLSVLWAKVIPRFAVKFVLTSLTIGVLNGLLTSDFGVHPAPLVSITGAVGMIALLVGAFVLLVWIIGHVTQKRNDSTRLRASAARVCWSCGYDLRGSPTEVCSECGHLQNPFAGEIAEISTWRRR